MFRNLRLLVSNVVSYKNIYNEGFFYFCLIVLCVFKHFPYLLVRVFPFCPFIYFFGGVTYMAVLIQIFFRVLSYRLKFDINFLFEY